MRVPTIRGVIDRRILVNYRVEPDVLSQVLPRLFRPKLVGDVGIAGICLIRLKHIRPRFLPRAFGISSENAAHRIAVEWDEDGQQREGVYVPRRDTSSRINAFLGGRLFPGLHHHCDFDVEERDGRYSLRLESDDGSARLSVVASVTNEFPSTSVFGSLAEASEFFERGSLGYSATRKPGEFDGIELRTLAWKVEPLAVELVESSFFEDRSVFPAGSVQFDSALLMQSIEHEWHGRESLCCSEAVSVGE